MPSGLREAVVIPRDQTLAEVATMLVLLGGAVGPGHLGDASLNLLLDAIIADRSRRVEAASDISANPHHAGRAGHRFAMGHEWLFH